MQYTKLGNSDLNVSRICMGCMGFGDAGNGQHTWTVDEAQSREIIKQGLELGVNFFDTAIAYQSGTSEQYLGRAIKDFAKRDDIVMQQNSCPVQHKKSNRAFPCRSTLKKCLIKAFVISVWIMWIYIFTICGITQRLFMTLWRG